MVDRRSYFHNMSWVLLLLVFLGFAPSFYLQPLLSPHPFYPDGLPLVHVVHGIILTGWYVLLVIQTRLIKFGRLGRHRQLGWFSAGWALLVLASTIWVVTVFPKRMHALAAQLESTVEQLEPGLSAILWLDVFMCLLFTAFISIALLKRHRPEIHKRLMLFSGLVFIFAATNRLAGIISHLLGLELSLPLGLIILLILTSSILVYDRKTYGKILPVSWWCFGLYWFFSVLSFVISITGLGSLVTDVLPS